MPEPLPPHLAKFREEIKELAKSYGLDFFETIFQILDYDEVNMVAAYGGFPTRYPHWRFGMEYESLSKGYQYGLQKIYEMVINTNPSYAYLMKGNTDTDQKLVMAHVYGHVDFFKNNVYFAHTNRKMIDEMANHATRIRRYVDRLGIEPVENFIDACLSIENLIDRHLPAIKRRKDRKAGIAPVEEEIPVPQKIRAKSYMDPFINPKEFLEQQQKKIDAERGKARRFPEEPERDVMLFLLENAPLEPWEQDILEIIRDEAYYFAPQGMTKVMNEGWASFWHSTLMTRHILTPGEVIDYADHHSGTLATSPGRLNPYKLGIELFRDIEDRWNKGKFGKEYEECRDLAEIKAWDRKLGKGREKIFEVRRLHNDVTFIDEFLTPEFAIEQKLFTFDYNKNTNSYEIRDRAFQKVKDRLLFMLTNHGQPPILVADGNFENRGELLLLHRYEGIGLEPDYAKDTLKNVHAIWRRPVNLDTTVDGKRMLLTYDGKEHKEKELAQMQLL